MSNNQQQSNEQRRSIENFNVTEEDEDNVEEQAAEAPNVPKTTNSNSEKGVKHAKPFLGSLVQYKKKEQVALPATKESNVSKLLGLYELKSTLVYKACVIEFIGSTLLIFASCATTISVLRYGFPVPPLLIALSQIIILSFFIMATAKASGGHLNPMISIATMIVGFTSPTRAILYILSQMSGSILGAALLFGVVEDPTFGEANCFLGSIARGRALIAETVGSVIILFIAFGTALDIGQREIFGPILGPFFVGFSVAMVIFAGGGLVPGYIGPVGNPLRCFGPAVVSVDFSGHWVFWVGPIIAAILVGVLYRTLPPGFHEIHLRKHK